MADRMRFLPAFVRAPFAWRFHHAAGAWEYFVNSVTGRRAACNVGGHSPLDWEWLLTNADHHPLIDGVPAWRSAYRGSLPNHLVWT